MKTVRLNAQTEMELQDTLRRRSTNSFSEQQAKVNIIVADIRERGDEALFEYTERFDGVKLTEDTVTVTEE
ncbi:MAG: histidinol dehydrogenase, partial [Lachnospiraceae bacterium]|nr:histidinol dehydrogenase [Lachnospiraceae bacterium]